MEPGILCLASPGQVCLKPYAPQTLRAAQPDAELAWPLLQARHCADADAITFEGNVAHSVPVGWWADAADMACSRLANFTAHHVSEVRGSSWA